MRRLALLLALFPAPAPACVFGGIEARLSPALDLLVLVESLGREPQTAESRYPIDPRCLDLNAARFGAYRGHPAVTRLRGLHDRGYDFNRLAAAIAPASEPPGLSVRDPGELGPWLESLRDFAQRSGFADYERGQARRMAPVLDQLCGELRQADYVRKAEAYSGLRMDIRYVLLPSACHPQGVSLNNVLRSPEGRDVLFTAFGPREFEDGEARFAGGFDQPPGNLWHEIGHRLLDPLADTHASEVAALRPLYRRMESYCYGSWEQCLREHAVRAFKNRLIERERGPVAAAADLRAELAHGFVYLEPLARALRDYEEHRDLYPTLDAFYPRWLRALRDAAPSRPAPRVEVVFDPMVELVSVLELLGPEHPRCGSFQPRRDWELVRRTRERFAPFRAHPAVAATAGLAERGIDCARRDVFLLQAQAPAGLRPSLPPHARPVLDPGGGPALQERWLHELEDFARASSFLDYYRERRESLRGALDSFQEELDRLGAVAAVERYTGLTFRGDYHVLASIFYAPAGPVSGRIDFDDGAAGLRTIEGPARVAEGAGPPAFSTSGLEHVLYHEVAHVLLDPLAAAHSGDLERSRSLLLGLELRHYRQLDWSQAVEEHLVRAVKNRLLALRRGEEAAAQDLRHEEGEGFRYLERFVDRLREYEKDRPRYPDLAAFYPRWIAVLDEIAEEQGKKATISAR